MKDLLVANQTPWFDVDSGDAHAGLVRLVKRSDDPKKANEYRINVNKNHDLPTQVCTVAHELGHIYLGHLGSDEKRRIKDRRSLASDQIELEAESVAYLLCKRTGIAPRSEPYLSAFVEQDRPVDRIDIHAVMIATGAVETVLELNRRAFKSTVV